MNDSDLSTGRRFPAAGWEKGFGNRDRARLVFLAIILVLVTASICLLLSCGGAGTSISPGSTPTAAQVTTILTDPPTCGVPNGPFSHVWVTIVKVTAHVNANAADTDSGWQTLVDLSTNPRQIDLFSLASPACVLTQLGSTTGLPPGNYQQIRLLLLSNSPANGTATPSPNNCATVNAFNCVQSISGTSPLTLSSEAQTGLKIPPGQIFGGAISVQASQAVDVSIDFNACASILQQGDGSYRLKPTLRAGVVSVTNNDISGTVVIQGGTTGISGAIVLLEQPDNSVTPSIDRVQAAAITDPSGHFIFCPLPGQGPYDVVVAATTGDIGSQVTYNPTIAFGVPMGTNLTNLPLVPETRTPSAPATITGQVTTQVDSTAPAAQAVTLSALQGATPTGGTLVGVTIPVFGVMSQPPVGSTALIPNPDLPVCPANTDCLNFSFLVPASNALVATYDSSSHSITFPATPPAASTSYNVNAWDADCSTANATTTSPVLVSPGVTTNLPTDLMLSGCPASM